MLRIDLRKLGRIILLQQFTNRCSVSGAGLVHQHSPDLFQLDLSWSFDLRLFCWGIRCRRILCGSILCRLVFPEGTSRDAVFPVLKEYSRDCPVDIMINGFMLNRESFEKCKSYCSFR